MIKTNEWNVCTKENMPEFFIPVFISPIIEQKVYVAQLEFDLGGNSFWETVEDQYTFELQEVSAWMPIVLPDPYERVSNVKEERQLLVDWDELGPEPITKESKKAFVDTAQSALREAIKTLTKEGEE